MLGGAVAADAQEPHVRILDAAESFALAEAKQGLPRAKLHISASPLDARLALPACTQGLNAFKPSGGRVIGNAVIGVRCAGPHPWTLYVPVQVSARLAVVVAVRPLVRGTQLMASELALADRDLSNLAYGYLTGKTQAVGQVLTRDVMAGQVVLPAMLSPPILVRRGQMVTVMSGGSGIEVTTEGVALASGSRGQAIKVRNSHSQRIIEGVVSGPGKVTVGG
ncbi:flagella basal body P-ring formation protein FlgA [Acidihalobacter yilgarnensis]|uniref:Flagella basal body P-ring formation protein FlgA n=1 Tax=Acidihalobacter yilgarnensis TaxID=2819280 RepID=A0A1D8IPQ8_9GAMM|nr:flagellar basal body P-ring formation chaperone FlgA [Acidihalobacter yilgarnensis]AOU98441.1 flagella basal body P-ring formation protein FlgA [Acidihalobacter yilgarnensis]